MTLEKLLELTGGEARHENGCWKFQLGRNEIVSAQGVPQDEFVKLCEETILQWWSTR